MAQQTWAAARERDDYASFAPWLDRIFALARERADAVGYERRARATTRCSTTTSRADDGPA